MKISEHIHGIRIDFHIPAPAGDPLERCVYAYWIGGAERICLVDSGVAGSEQRIFDDIAGAGRRAEEVEMLVLTHAHAEEIARLALERGLVVGVDYHKRFDYRNMIARSEYRKGRFGEFRLAQANLHECWY